MVARKNSIFNQIIWFDKRIENDIDSFDIFLPQRTVNNNPRYKSGVYISEKCKRPIQYESGKELEFIHYLEESNQVLYYWEQPIRIPYRRGRRKDTYTPDFAVYLDTKEIVLVEIKDLSGMLDNRVQMKMEALLKFCSRNGFGLLLTDGKNNLDKLDKITYNKELAENILAAVAGNRILHRDECREIIKKSKSNQNELLKVIIKHNLKFKASSFKLEQESKNILFRHVFIEKKRFEDFRADKFNTLFNRTELL